MTTMTRKPTKLHAQKQHKESHGEQRNMTPVPEVIHPGGGIVVNA
ncbi:MAG TPA: hypothetical protein VK470_08855 [Bacteroidota bacterium]|nr:hypothetical protein [Bacteroidota bacterium]